MTLLVLGVGPEGADHAAAALPALRELAPGHPAVLVLRDDRVDAEAFAPLASEPAVERAAARFDRAVSLNEALGWVHPRALTLRGDSIAVVEAMLRREWGLGGHLVVAADAFDDDRLLWRLFPAASLAAYAAPGRDVDGWDEELPASLAHRVTAVVVPERTTT